MSVEKIIRFVKGYVVVCCEGRFCERFLNVCMRRGIYLGNVRWLGEERLSVCMSIAAFREIREIARKTRTRVAVTSRCGLPFVLHRYRKRKALLGGVVVFAAILWYLATHVTGIDVMGNERLSDAAVVEGLKEFGVFHGAVVADIDHTSVKNRMMTKFDEIAWIGINLKGSRVYVEIKERLDTPIRLGTDIPCDIIAERSGVIKLLEVKEGKTMVRLNQYVEEGDLLVSGVIDSQVKGMRFVHSFGDIYAETIYEKTGEYTFEYEEKIYTGRTKKRYSISSFGKTLNLFVKKEAPFKYSDLKKGKKEYKAPMNFIPSLFVEWENYAEYRIEKRMRSLEETVDFGKNALFSELDSELSEGVEVMEKKVKYSETEKGVMVTAEYICRENIAKQRIIDKTEVLGYDVE